MEKDVKIVICGSIVIIMLISILGAEVLTGVIKIPESRYFENNNDIHISTSYLVRYEVTGTADSVSVTYENRDGGISQESNVNLPWSCPPVFCPDKSGDFVYISAQNNGEYGSVTTKIYVDGMLFKTSTSYGAYVIASSSGRLP